MNKALPRHYQRVCALAAFLFLACCPAQAQETVCARVKIEIKQELTLERQAFDAEMKINNTTETGTVENVSVEVKVTDEAGVPVLVSTNPNDLSAKFFIRLSNKQNISAADGTGSVSPRTTATLNWLLIPAPGSAGNTPMGKKYLVGATLKYKFAGESTVLEVSPDVITVKPMPLLSLDYFLTEDVWGDDPLTDAVEPIEPYTLGVRVKNNGFGIAKNLKIDSAQPRIVENKQSLLVDFKILGSYVNDAPAENTLLIDFGEIPPGTAKMGRWNMESTLAGKFSEFTADFTHADELGGAMTSLLQAARTHFLLRDVRVDLPGRDLVKDFLGRNQSGIRVFESDGPDTEVIDRSSVATLATTAQVDRISFPPTAGFAYARIADPSGGKHPIGRLLRSDGKELAAENVWLSKTRIPGGGTEYWINVFDANSTGSYQVEYAPPPAVDRPPVLQFIPDRTAEETRQVSFIVEASSPDDRPVTLSAAPLPVGAQFTPQQPSATAPGVTLAVFDWTPPRGTAGTYVINYTASDGRASASRAAKIQVSANAPPPGPGTPQLVAPLAGANVTSLRPSLSVQPGVAAGDPTRKIEFELFADETATRLVASTIIDKAPDAPGNGGGPVPVPTAWRVPEALNDNTHYWWRARAFDGKLYSPWVNGRFFANTFNDPPDRFNLTHPVPDAVVSSRTPSLAWTNAHDKDGEPVTYSVFVAKDLQLAEVVAQAADLAADASGITRWTVTTALDEGQRYYWRVVAQDPHGGQTASALRTLRVQAGNTPPTTPVAVSPVGGNDVAATSVPLIIQASIDAENDLITYIFEIDMVNSFDSANKRSSGEIIGGSAEARWVAEGLVENARYFWRVKARDGRAESPWVAGSFRVNAINDPPPVATVKNPGDGAWVDQLQPTFEANPVTDPDGDSVRYQFEVFKDAALTLKVAEGVSAHPTWMPPAPLADKTTFHWRVRPVDAGGATAARWSKPATLYVSSGLYQEPRVALTTPATFVTPAATVTPAGTLRQVTLRWEGVAPNIDARVALYYSSRPSGFEGTLIVDGLRQEAGKQSGEYVWDTGSLAPGAWYVYAVLYDAKGFGRAYAPGAVVVPTARQQGRIIAAPAGPLLTSEAGGVATLKVRLDRAPTSEVVIPLTVDNPREGAASPASLTFTPQNWSADQTVTLSGRADCIPDPDRAYQFIIGRPVSADPDYMNLAPPRPFAVTNADNPDSRQTTQDPNLHICSLSIVSEREVSAGQWAYTLRAELYNSGPSVNGLTATRPRWPAGWASILSSRPSPDSELSFGAVGQGEAVMSGDTFVVNTTRRVSAAEFATLSGLSWTVEAAP